MGLALKMVGVVVAFLIAGIVAIVIFSDLWFRVGFGTALVVVCGGLLLVAWRVDKKDRDARAGLENV